MLKCLLANALLEPGAAWVTQLNRAMIAAAVMETGRVLETDPVMDARLVISGSPD